MKEREDEEETNLELKEGRKHVLIPKELFFRLKIKWDRRDGRIRTEYVLKRSCEIEGVAKVKMSIVEERIKNRKTSMFCSSLFLIQLGSTCCKWDRRHLSQSVHGVSFV